LFSFLEISDISLLSFIRTENQKINHQSINQKIIDQSVKTPSAYSRVQRNGKNGNNNNNNNNNNNKTVT
jgi:hypothetical protein